MGEKGQRRKQKQETKARETKARLLAALQKARAGLDMLSQYKPEIESDPELHSRAEEITSGAERAVHLWDEAVKKDKKRRQRLKVLK